MTRKQDRFHFNLMLLMTGIVSAGSGFLLQLNYHMGHGGRVWGQSRAFWSWSHKVSSVLFLGAVVYHLLKNAKWIKNVLTRRRLGRHKEVTMLSGLFIVASLVGLVAWIVVGCAHPLHHVLVEVHDKLTLLLFVFLILHVWKRRRRFVFWDLRG